MKPVRGDDPPRDEGDVAGQGRIRQRGLRAAAAALAAGLWLVLVPAPAAAAPGDSLRPFIDCVTRKADGSWTAVLGYENTARSAVVLAPGPKNKITPLKGVAVPGRFEPGVRHGALAVTVVGHSSFLWHLGDDQLKVRSTSTPCPPETEMPTDGNGTGVVVALAVAGLAGLAGSAVTSTTARRGGGTRRGAHRA
jgi:hypothetical protein